MHVQINSADGLPVEDGEAKHGAGNLWIYAATQKNTGLGSAKIVVSASDLPGNVTTEEMSL
ncbi:MAG: hypothetical protein LBR08_06500 [Bacteroidales bacterium]|nr:hypothetical protein [Bacteroidales bacterium]